jgi:hypothetical protein
MLAVSVVRIAVLLTCAALLAPAARAAAGTDAGATVVGADGLELPDIVVHEDATISLDGRSPSLRAVVEEICVRAGVQLRAYDAVDRRMRGHYERLRLSDILGRLLREESFVLGFSGRRAGERNRVRWLRVFDRSDRSGSRAKGGGSPANLIPAAAYDNDSPSTRRRTTLRFLQNLDRQPQFARRITQMRDQEILEVLARGAYSAEFAGTLARELQNRSLRAKFARIAARLRRTAR